MEQHFINKMDISTLCVLLNNVRTLLYGTSNRGMYLTREEADRLRREEVNLETAIDSYLEDHTDSEFADNLRFEAQQISEYLIEDADSTDLIGCITTMHSTP